MIESITIADVATYGSEPQELSGLSLFNFLYGSNGTGKTTISRVIADESQYSSCHLKWKNSVRLQPIVYNHDFVDRNFHQTTELKGVFTLGEKHVDAITAITQAKEELNRLASKLQERKHTLGGEDGSGGKRQELARLEVELKDKCWSQKQRHDERFQVAFEGYRGSAEKFRRKILDEAQTNSAELVAVARLEERASVVFGERLESEPLIGLPDARSLLAHEANPILSKRIVGKKDVDIAALIERLGSSDWVRTGRGYYDADERTCPFCQQKAPANLASRLNTFFDESFEADTVAIGTLAARYEKDASHFRQSLDTILVGHFRFLDVDKFKTQKQLLGSIIDLNIKRIAEKQRQPSQAVELETLAGVCTELSRLINDANESANEHNNVIANIKIERATLTAQVWRFLVEELKGDLDAYAKKAANVNKAIDGLEAAIEALTNQHRAKLREISTLERSVTSVQPTVEAINQLLSSFGFQSFKLATSTHGTSYKLVREDGTDAKATLSEGEKSFVTFLYFYHLLKGSESESGIATDRIVVFDDPVSSLDSDVLFIISSLIKGIFNEVRLGSSHIKQVFVLTHNVYFHKEVSYSHKRNRHGTALNEETFWVIRKGAERSEIEKYESNPIKTSYELLWSEVRRADRSPLTIQNTLRRILENYFKILGGIDRDYICSKFTGRESIICRSLFEWVNDGSHSAHDDLYLQLSGTTTEAYLEVFRMVFERMGHLEHYRMMMRGEDVEEPVVAAIA